MRLSVIVPVFNGERYIGDCLRALMNPSSEVVEVIVINDGSTDRTGEVVLSGFRDEIARGRLRYVDTPNGGVSVARNHGLDLAAGDYVAFVDADDLVSLDYIQALLAAIERTPDIIEIGYRTIDTAGVELRPEEFIHRRFGFHGIAEVRDAVFASCLWYPVLRVVRRAVLGDVRFPAGVKFCEDLMAISEVYGRASTVLTLQNVLYAYRVNPRGATQNVRPDYVPQLVAFYRTLQGRQDFPSQALRINVAFAARSCLTRSTDPLGRLPSDIEWDLRMLVLRGPRLLVSIPFRFLIFGVAGPALFLFREWLRKLKRKGKLDSRKDAHKGTGS